MDAIADVSSTTVDGRGSLLAEMWLVKVVCLLPYRSFGDTIPVPTVARVHFLSPKLWYYYQLGCHAFLLAKFWYLHRGAVILRPDVFWSFHKFRHFGIRSF